MKTESYPMTDREHATVLAALRYYQQQNLADGLQRRPAAIRDITIGYGRSNRGRGLTARGIDRLCERSNAIGETPPAPKLPATAADPDEARTPGPLHAPNRQGSPPPRIGYQVAP